MKVAEGISPAQAAAIEALVLTLLPIGRTLAHNHGPDIMLSALINLAVGLARAHGDDAEVAATLEAIAGLVRDGRGPRFALPSGGPIPTVAPGVAGHG